MEATTPITTPKPIPGKARRPGRKRWGPLIKFLTIQMEKAGSERVRMQAALKLADILSLREQREQLEMRRESRVQPKAGDELNETPEASAEELLPVSREDALREAQAFLARMGDKTNAIE